MSTTPSTQPTLRPVDVSPTAQRALSEKIREWSGWSTGTLRFGVPADSPYAEVDYPSKQITANIDALLLNPHRVLRVVTPFRLRQEAVLTGALMHEAAHARYSLWRPRTVEALKGFMASGHADGTPVTEAEFSFALLMEEARIEGMMAREAKANGTRGLTWTMRAATAHLLPPTDLSASHDQQVMDVITSWALRAGRIYAMSLSDPNFQLPKFYLRFNNLLHQVLTEHLEPQGMSAAPAVASQVTQMMRDMIAWGGAGPSATASKSFPVDQAREILAILFPETPPEDQPQPSAGCGAAAPGEPDEGEDEDSGTEGSDSDEGEPDEGESDEGEEGATDSTDSDDSDGDDSDGDDSDGDDSDGDDSDSAMAALAAELARMEAAAKTEAKEAEAKQDANDGDADDEDDSGSAGSGSSGDISGKWRQPTPDERIIAKGAERFLRDMIDPTESSKAVLTDQPSAMVDGAALASWKAGGETREPHFFMTRKRTVEPSPPVQIAILVDVSGSMDELQKPSAMLSWALASAAMDLRNFAGRGRQVEACLIHWGDYARVIQANGQIMPGIREYPCWEGTSAQAAALEMVEAQMPGFFTLTERPVNRLLVQFTDWELSWDNKQAAYEGVHRAIGSGVNMLSVVPNNYSNRRSDLPDIMAQCKEQRGVSSILRYDPAKPGQIWDTATRLLSGAPATADDTDRGRPAPFPGF